MVNAGTVPSRSCGTSTAAICISTVSYTHLAVAGETEIRFSHASTSEYVYPDGTRFEEIEKLEGIRQTVLPADARVADGTLVNVRAMFGNENIPVSYTHLDVYKRQG